MSNSILTFFREGGVFLFDENNSQSESSYYLVEDLMGEEEGSNITEATMEDSDICIFYDCSSIDEETAITKYKQGNYVNNFRNV